MTIIVFMVAGMSSRFGGNPKQMAIIGPKNETLIEYSVNQAIKNNFNKIIFITNSKTENLFVNIFGHLYKNIPVEYIRQKYDVTKRTRPWGTTDAVCSLIETVKEPFILVNGDDIYGEETFKEGFNKMKVPNINIIGGLQLLKTLPDNGTVNRGIIFTSGKKVIGLKEMLNISKEDNQELHTEFANVNFIGLQIAALSYLKKSLDKFKFINIDDSKIESLLPDDLNNLIKKKLIEMEFFEIKNNILGITNPGDENIIKEKLISNNNSH